MSSLRATSLSVIRPPKPPCWRDFVAPTPRSINSDGVDIIEHSGRMPGARSPVSDLIQTSRIPVSLPGNKSNRLVRRPRAKIHRTRSEHVIQAEDLPESSLTTTLADTVPKGLRSRDSDDRPYVEENNRRCQNWLASIEAAEPLDTVDYTSDQQPLLTKDDLAHDAVRELASNKNTDDDTDTGSSRQTEGYLIPIYELQQGVDVEVPEETFVWSTAIHSPRQSPSTGEELCSPCREIKLRENCHVVTGSAPCPSPGDDNQPNRHCSENVRYERQCASISSCGKVPCDKKCCKRCCDRQDSYSISRADNCCSSKVDNGCSHCLMGCNEGSISQRTQEDAPRGSMSPARFHLSSSTHRIRTSSRPSTAEKLTTDADTQTPSQSTNE